MRQRLYLYGLLACLLACDSSNPVAPPGTVLTLTAAPTQIALQGSALLTVTGFRPDGNPLNPGTQINLTTTLGVLQPTLATVGDDGRATATLTGDGRPGTATVTARTPASESEASVDIQIGETSETKPTLSITATPDEIGFDEVSEIICVARHADGTLYGSGGRVLLRTSLGELGDEDLTTDVNGEARTTLESGIVPGTATITGSVGSSDEVTIQVTIEDRKPDLQIFANPSSIPVQGESEISIVARDNNDVPLGAGHEISLFADLGSIRSQVRTDGNGHARATFTAGTQGGTGSVTAILGTSDPATVNIQIRDAATSINLTANPTSIVRGDASISLSAVVRNAQGEGVQSILVTFESDLGSLSQSGVQTNTRGEATSTLTVTQAQLPDSITQFDVRASVISEGVTLEDVVTITVQ